MNSRIPWFLNLLNKKLNDEITVYFQWISICAYPEREIEEILKAKNGWFAGDLQSGEVLN